MPSRIRLLRGESIRLGLWVGASSVASNCLSPNAALWNSNAQQAKHTDPDSLDQIGTISRKLVEIVDELSRFEHHAGASDHSSKPQPIIKLREAIRVRSLRNRLFPKGLFSDPAWDMILDLTLATIEHRQISISSLCIASNVPTTTALRCIKALVAHEIIQVVADSKDRRRKIVQLSSDTLDRMINLADKIL